MPDEVPLLLPVDFQSFGSVLGRTARAISVSADGKTRTVLLTQAGADGSAAVCDKQ